MGTFRFVLAIAVAVTHYHGMWGYDPMITAEMAVQCFYMVSGFLIALILSGKYDTTTTAGLRLLCHIVVASIGFVIAGQDGGWFSLAGSSGAVAVAVCYVHWIDVPFEMAATPR